MIACLAAALAAAATTPPARAQVPADVVASDTLWQVQLADGSTLFGRVVQADGQGITLVSEAGVRVELTRAQVRTMSRVRGTVRDGSVWIEDPNTTRLFFGPTGRMMRAGEGYVAAFELFLPFLSYSLTDWFTMAGGTPLVPDALGEVLYIAPKLGLYQGDQLALGAGVLAFFSTDNDFDSAGIAYGVGTWGSPDQAITFGAGWPFAGSDLESRPVFMGGGEARLTRRTKFVSENYLFTLVNGGNNAGMVSGGIRFIGERLSADLGVGFGFDGSDGICCIPLVNFVYNLGRER